MKLRKEKSEDIEVKKKEEKKIEDHRALPRVALVGRRLSPSLSLAQHFRLDRSTNDLIVLAKVNADKSESEEKRK